MLLSEVCEIKTGLTLKNGIQPSLYGKYAMLQLGDIDTAGRINTHSVTLTNGDPSYEKFLVQTGDLIFRGRGAGIAVAMIPKDSMPFVVASPLIILRPLQKVVDPTFLATMLTSKLAMAHFSKFIRGSNIMGIGITDLKIFDFPLPALKIQKIIAGITILQNKEQALLHHLTMAKNRIINQKIEHLLTHHEMIHKECIND